MNENEIESEINKKGLNAPRIKPEDITAVIASAQYHVFEDSQLTVCCITLVNGFTVTGTSACASPENFNAEIGQEIAFNNAREQIWALEGYLLKQKLYDASKNDEQIVNTCIDSLIAHAQEMELSQINFLDICRNYCEGDLTKCKTVQYCFIDGALFEVTFEESEQLDDFAFKLREADNHG